MKIGLAPSKATSKNIEKFIDELIDKFEKRESGLVIELSNIKCYKQIKKATDCILDYLKTKHPNYIIGTIFKFPTRKKAQIYLTS